MIDFQKCETCKHYKPHYYFSGNRLIPAKGHCVNDELVKSRRRNAFRLQENCGHWEDRMEVLKDRNQSIKNYICEINKHLAWIQAVLETENQF